MKVKAVIGIAEVRAALPQGGGASSTDLDFL